MLFSLLQKFWITRPPLEKSPNSKTQPPHADFTAKTPMLHSHPLLHLKPLPKCPTRIFSSIHFRIPTKVTFPGPDLRNGNFRFSPLMYSSPLKSSSYSISSNSEDFNVELGRLLALLPEEMRRRVSEHPELQDLIEVVMDLGRKPLARFPSGDFVLSDLPITMEDIQQATSQVR